MQTLLRAGIGCITYLRYFESPRGNKAYKLNLVALETYCQKKILSPVSGPPDLIHLNLALSPARGLLTASSDGSISSEASTSGIFTSNKSGALSRVANGFAVTTITRGWSAEADKLLDYLVRMFDYPGLVHTLTCLSAIGKRDFRCY